MTSAHSSTVETIVARTIELTQTPAPTFDESDRAQALLQWWEELGVSSLHTDQVGNVIGQIRGIGSTRPAVLVCAHLDTVFDRDVLHETHLDGNILTGPSVGDDSVALAALTHLTEILPADFDSPLWIAATVGEEGLGNLNGVINLLDNPPATFAYVIALEGNYLGRVNITGVGSARYLVELDGPGGHSWEESHQPNAVEAAAHFVTAYRRLFDAKIAELHGKATLNFGTIFGGESVNSRAKGCAFSVDLRAEDAGTLAAIQELLESERGDHFDDFEVTVTALGIRPAGSIEPDHPLVRAAVEAANRHGLEPTLSAASTDANAAYARGLPAITLGVAFGGDTHTLREWIDISSIDLGVTILADTLIALTTLEG